MSSTFIHDKERRLVRLKQYFKPYRSIEIILDSDVSEPFVLQEAEMTKRRNYKLKVSPLVLLEKAPEWVERTILRLVIEQIKSRQIDFESEQLRTRLSTFFTSAKQRQAEEAKKIEQSMASAETTDIAELWLELRREYFPDRADIDDYKVVWSTRRQTSCLASCSIENRRIFVAEAMKDPLSSAYLAPLIYHEMCHAILGAPKIVNGRRVIHGKDFKALEKRHPQIPALNEWIKAGGWNHVTKRADVLRGHTPKKPRVRIVRRRRRRRQRAA